MLEYNKQTFKQLSSKAGNCKYRTTVLITKGKEAIKVKGKIMFPNQIVREFGDNITDFMYEIGVGGSEKCLFAGQIVGGKVISNYIYSERN